MSVYLYARVYIYTNVSRPHQDQNGGPRASQTFRILISLDTPELTKLDQNCAKSDSDPLGQTKIEPNRPKATRIDQN